MSAIFDAAATLLELLVAVLILGVISVVGTVAYTDALASQRLSGAVNRIAAELQNAKHIARNRTQAITFAFDAANARCTITGMANPDHPAGVYILDLAGGTNVRIAAVNFGGDASLTINGYGFPDSGGTLTLAAGTLARTVTIQASNGEVIVP